MLIMWNLCHVKTVVMAVETGIAVALWYELNGAKMDH
jgi:hypothetical protein